MMAITVPHKQCRKSLLWILCALMVLAACANASPGDSSGTNRAAAAKSGDSISIFCGGGAQFEVTGPDGQRVLMDVNDPELLSRPPDEKDILLTTHFHMDHYHQTFMDSFPGALLKDRQSKLQRPGLSVKGMASQHTGRPWNPTDSAIDNYIFVIETGGLRVAHFGDIGQNKLTADQLEILGRVDVAITQFVNPYSEMDLENLKGFNLMTQLRPKIIIPHHGVADDDAIRIARERWQVVCASGDRLVLSQKMLPDRTTVVIMGEMRDYMQKTFDLKMWP